MSALDIMMGYVKDFSVKHNVSVNDTRLLINNVMLKFVKELRIDHEDVVNVIQRLFDPSCDYDYKFIDRRKMKDIHNELLNYTKKLCTRCHTCINTYNMIISHFEKKHHVIYCFRCFEHFCDENDQFLNPDEYLYIRYLYIKNKIFKDSDKIIITTDLFSKDRNMYNFTINRDKFKMIHKELLNYDEIKKNRLKKLIIEYFIEIPSAPLLYNHHVHHEEELSYYKIRHHEKFKKIHNELMNYTRQTCYICKTHINVSSHFGFSKLCLTCFDNLYKMNKEANLMDIKTYNYLRSQMYKNNDKIRTYKVYKQEDLFYEKESLYKTGFKFICNLNLFK